MTTFGHRYAFHAFIKVITPAAAYVAFMTGRYIRKKIPISETPSIRAASIMSMGKRLEFCRNSMIKNGVETDGSINPHTLFKSPSLEIILNSGIIVATPGTIIAKSRIENKKSLYLS